MMPMRLRTIAIAAALVVAPTLAFGHAVVYPKASTPGAYERYVLRVPNEKATATTRVELRVPSDVRVSSFADVPGWQLEVLTDSAQRIIGAVWTGTLPPKRFVEFPFVAVNPKVDTSVVWASYQTYADGEKVEWAGAPGSKAPASVTTIAAVKPPVTPEAPVNYVSWAALGVAVIALGLALRPRAG